MKKLALLLGTIVAGHTALELARDALFLEHIPIGKLPWVYLLVAVVSLAISFVPIRSAHARLSGLLAIGAIGSGIIGALPTTRPLLYVLYVWTGVIASLSVSHFWAAVASRFSLASAKRFYTSIGFGGLAGAIVGAAVVRGVVEIAPVRWLVWIAAALFAIGAIFARFALGQAQELDADKPVESERHEPVPVPYVRRVALLLLAGSVTVTLLDFAFKRTLVDSGASIARIVSNVAVAGSVFSALVQLFVLPRLLRRFSVTNLLRWLPSVVLVGVLGAFAFGNAALVATRLGDMMLRFSLHKTAVELLFLPMGHVVRAKVKSRIDVMPQRIGQALAGGIALLAAAHWPTLVLSVLALASIAWLVAVRGVSAKYVELFRQRVRERSSFTGILPQLDVAAVESIVGNLGSADDREVLAALDVLEQQNKPNLVPTLLLHHPSREVLVRALDIMMRSNRTDAVGLVKRLLDSSDAIVRAHALRALSLLAFDEERTRESLADESPVVRATALVLLQEDPALDDEETQIAFLEAVRLMPHDRFAPAIAQLARDGSLAVRRAAFETMNAHPHPSYVSIAIAALAVRSLRPLARQVLIAANALHALRAALEGRRFEERVTIHIPRTISRFAPNEAIPVLLDIFENDPDGLVRHKALRGLGRIVTDHGIQIDVSVLDREIAKAITFGANVVTWRVALQSLAHAPRTQPLMLDVTQSKIEHAIERIFRLLELRDRAGQWQTIHHGLRSADAKEREAALELFSRNVPSQHAAATALIDPSLSDHARREELRSVRATDPATWSQLFAEMRARGGRTLGVLAAETIWREAS